MLNCFERAEEGMSSRYGIKLINRDPDGTMSGTNYPFVAPVVAIAKLLYAGTPHRYVGLGNGNLFRRDANTLGQFTEIYSGLSGQPFGSLVTNCYQSAQPYLFIYDLNQSIKDSGTGTPQLTGIDPSPYTINALPYSPLLTLVDNFASGNSYVSSGFSVAWAYNALITLTSTGGQLVTDFPEFFGVQQSGTGSHTISGGTTTATVTGVGSNSASNVYSGFASSTVTPVETVSLSVTLNGSVTNGIHATGSGTITLSYSTDSGATWTLFFSQTSAPGTSDIGGTLTITVPGLTNIDTLEIKVDCAITTLAGSTSTTSTVAPLSSIVAVITVANIFGPVQNGMLSLLGGSAPVAVPIVGVVSADMSGSQFTTLLVTTQTAHGYTANTSLVAIYASSNDLVDGFYLVTATPSATTYKVDYLSNVQLSAAGGVSWGGGSNHPTTCVLANLYSTPYPTQMSAWGFYEQVPTSTASFPVGSWQGTVAASTAATVGVTVPIDLSQQNQVNDDDLIVITIAVDDPSAISSIRLQFDVAGSNFTSSYYYKDLSPSYYQGNIQQTESAYDSTEQQIFADTIDLVTGQPPGTVSAQLQPGNISTGQGTWIAVYLRRGDFVAVGSAGQSGLDWSAISGWQLVITANAVGSAVVAVNGLYLQWGYGPSSFGGVGYNYRHTYFDSATGTESNPDPEQRFSSQFGYLASLSSVPGASIGPTYLRQAVQVVGQYSTDPQVTHVRIYRQGGIYSGNWFMIDQFPNIVRTGPFYYKDVIPDAVLAAALPLSLDNDPPVTSTLQSPIATTLLASTSSPGTSIYSTFSPQTITVAQAGAIFVPRQVVDIGYATNLEQVMVIVGETGTFTAIVRLQHNAGEPVNVYSTPRQPTNLCDIAYGQVWLAGDVNNPHYLYFSKKGRPENFSPAAYIPVGSPQFPITAVINWRGTLFVRTLETWWLIVGGPQPYAQPTGSIHGSSAIKGFALTESSIWSRSLDGLRQFQGADGQYMSLPVEFIYRQTAGQTPLPLTDPTQIAADVMAYFNNMVLTSYISTTNSGQRFRIIWDTQYSRYRIDDIAATAMLWEKDTNLLLVGVPSATPSEYYLAQDQVIGQDYDDGGWAGGTLVQLAINLTVQFPYFDLKKPHFPKQWNVLETDVNTAGQTMQTTLLFNTEPPTSLALPAYTGDTVRHKKQFQITPANSPAGSGVQAYSMSLQHTMAVKVAPIFYQEDIYAALLADYRTSFDTYWIKFSSDQSKIVKQCYFDYDCTAPITVNLYADGSTIPYYTFTLPIETSRLSVRRLFIAWKPRLWRLIATSAADFQFYSAPSVEAKPIREGSTYAITDLGSE